MSWWVGEALADLSLILFGFCLAWVWRQFRIDELERALTDVYGNVGDWWCCWSLFTKDNMRKVMDICERALRLKYTDVDF